MFWRDTPGKLIFFLGLFFLPKLPKTQIYQLFALPQTLNLPACPRSRFDCCSTQKASTAAGQSERCVDQQWVGSGRELEGVDV